MNPLLNPNTIYQKILKNEINEQEGFELLISIVERSDKSSTRMKSLEQLHKLQIKDKEKYRIFENCLISDENAEIRINCAMIILENYLQEGLKCLEWAIINDKSPKLLNYFENTLRTSKKSQHKALYIIYLQRLEKIAKELDIDSLEIPFLLDMEFNLSKYKILNWYTIGTLIYDKTVMFRIEEQHITELSISLRDNLPPSINLLKKLEYLNLSCNNLTELPNTLIELTNLKSLDLGWNDFKEVPTVLNKLKFIKKIIFRNNLVQS